MIISRYSLVYNIIDEDLNKCEYMFSNNFDELLTRANSFTNPWKIYDEKDSRLVATNNLAEMGGKLISKKVFEDYGYIPESTWNWLDLIIPTDVPIRIEVYRLDKDE